MSDFFLIFFWRGLKGRILLRKSPSRWKLPKSKTSQKKSKPKLWTRYWPDCWRGILLHGLNPPAFFPGSAQVLQVGAEKGRQDKLSKERRHCELLVHRVPGGRHCVWHQYSHRWQQTWSFIFGFRHVTVKISPMSSLQRRERKSKRSRWASKWAWGESSEGWVDAGCNFRTLVSCHTCSPRLGFQWDEALLTMSKGETARVEIDPEWAYGRKGLPDSKYPLCGPDLMHAADAGARFSLTPILSEFLPMQSWFLKLNWFLWTRAHHWWMKVFTSTAFGLYRLIVGHHSWFIRWLITRHPYSVFACTSIKTRSQTEVITHLGFILFLSKTCQHNQCHVFISIDKSKFNHKNTV